MKIAILTDSASNVTENKDKGIFTVPLYVNFGKYSKKDLVEISPQELFDKLETESPTTAAPSIDDFIQKIREIKSLGYDAILGVALSSELSATLNAMKLAFDEEIIEHRIVDSKGVSYSEGFLVIHAGKLLEKGHDLEYIYQEIERLKSGAKLYGMVSDLKYLVRGGRLKPLKGFIGSMLKINPILSTTEKGLIEPYASVRGKAKAVKKLKEILENDLKDCKEFYISILYSKDEELRDELRTELEELIQKAAEYAELTITAVLVAHAGPSLQAVAYLKVR